MPSALSILQRHEAQLTVTQREQRGSYRPMHFLVALALSGPEEVGAGCPSHYSPGYNYKSSMEAERNIYISCSVCMKATHINNTEIAMRETNSKPVAKKYGAKTTMHFHAGQKISTFYSFSLK